MGQPKATRLLVTVNSTGRQAASIIRVASAVGWRIRAQVRNREGLAFEELASLPGVDVVVGELEQPGLVDRLFRGAQLAFVNTTHYGDEVAVGKALADSAHRAGVEHYVYSSMPDHSTFTAAAGGAAWGPLPFWASKFEVEKYVRAIGIPATFVYAGIYNNNFTSLPYPLFRLELLPDKSFVWQAPFPPHRSLPWLDAEHDVGPALLQIFKEGPRRWSGHRIPLTFEVLTPVEACAALSRGLGRPVRYKHGPIEFKVPVPPGYKEHLLALQRVLGEQEAPYYGPTMYYPNEAIELWEGNRSLEEYAREVFPNEEAANGMTWMDDDDAMQSDASVEDRDDMDSSVGDGRPGSSRTSVAGDSANAVNL